MDAIDEAAWARYERDGFLRLGRTLDDAELAELTGRIDDYMHGRRRDDGLMMQLDVGGDYGAMAEMSNGFKGASDQYRKIENLERDDRYRAFLAKPLFRAICARAYGAATPIGVYRAMFMNKPARGGTVLPWHQDGGGAWDLDRDPLATVWTALDPATIANGCVQVIPGSHRHGLLHERGHVITDAHVAEHCAAEKIAFLELRPGESMLLHNWLLHRSDVNRTDIPRRAFSVCYLDARTRQRRSGRGFATIFEPEAVGA